MSIEGPKASPDFLIISLFLGAFIVTQSDPRASQKFCSFFDNDSGKTPCPLRCRCLARWWKRGLRKPSPPGSDKDGCISGAGSQGSVYNRHRGPYSVCIPNKRNALPMGVAPGAHRNTGGLGSRRWLSKQGTIVWLSCRWVVLWYKIESQGAGFESQLYYLTCMTSPEGYLASLCLGFLNC